MDGARLVFNDVIKLARGGHGRDAPNNAMLVPMTWRRRFV